MKYNWPLMTLRYFVRKIDGFSSSSVLVFTNGTTFPYKIFLQDLYIKREKMTYNWLLMTPRLIVCAKLMFSQAVLF